MIAHLVAAAAGLVVMAAPSRAGYSGTAADIDHVVGPLAVSVGIIAASQILRAFRWINLPLGLVLIASTLIAARTTTGSIVVAVAGAALVATAFVRGRVDVASGGGWASLWRNRRSGSPR